MDLQIIRANEMTEQSWSFGTTKQIYISPQGSDYASRDFDYRFSLATIEDENATFSSLPGVQRFFMALSDIVLEIDDVEKDVKEKEVVEFLGDQSVLAKGKGTHFNLMIKNPNFKASVNFLELQMGEFITEKIEDNIFYFLYKGDCLVKDFSISEIMHSGDLITIRPGKSSARLKIISEKPISLIRIDLLEEG